jgi:hypothetical protein
MNIVQTYAGNKIDSSLLYKHFLWERIFHNGRKGRARIIAVDMKFMGRKEKITFG